MSQGAFFLAAGLVPQHSLVARSGSCLALAMYGIFVGCASFLWTAALAYFLYVLVVCQRHAGSFRALAGWRPQWRRDVACACAVCFGYPFAVCAFLAVANAYFPGVVHASPVASLHDSFGCFVPFNDVTFRVAAIYGPLWGSMVLTTYWYIRTSRRIDTTMRACVKRGGSDASMVDDLHAASDDNWDAGDSAEAMLHRDRDRTAAADAAADVRRHFVRIRRKFLIIPLGFVLLRLPETLYRVLEYSRYFSGPGGRDRAAAAALQDTPEGKVLTTLRALTSPAQGIFNCAIFLWSSPVYRARLGALLRARCCGGRGRGRRKDDKPLAAAATAGYGTLMPGGDSSSDDDFSVESS